MTTQEKSKIVEAIKLRIARYGSQNKAANSIKNTSASTISQMLNGKWDLITDAMWKNVSVQVGSGIFKEWNIVSTKDFIFIKNLLNDARENSLTLAVVGYSGNGKTQAFKEYVANNKRVYLLECAEYWNRKMFLSELLTVMGIDCGGYTCGEMMNEVVRTLKIQENPLIIIDEADKLSDQVLYFFITLYNKLEDHCGIILSATAHLKKRITRGIKLNKKGYQEIHSRLGRKYIELRGVNDVDIADICIANGVSDDKDIHAVVQDSEGDLRRVKRKVHAIKQQYKTVKTSIKYN